MAAPSRRSTSTSARLPQRRAARTRRTTTSRGPAGRRLPAQGPGSARARRHDTGAYHRSAQQQLRRFRKGSALAVAITALVLLIWGVPLDPVEGAQPEAAQSATDVQEHAALPDPGDAVEEATSTIRALAQGFYGYLPRILLALAIFALAALITRLLGAALKRTLGGWQRTSAVSAVMRLVVYLVATIATLSILAGDVRAVVGSVGLLGLAASWALQTPIESFTGWLLNSFRGYYRVGDRIAVGDVFGDVYKIDVLTTTVWEAGGPGKPVAAAQATGALITFPNWEVLRSNIINYSRDFPYVWDETTFNIANESDLDYSVRILGDTARRVFGDQMAAAAQEYESLLRREGLLFDVDEIPYVYVSSADAWTECTVRYVVPVRSRRKWATTLLLEVARELARTEHKERIIPVYPRTEAVVYPEWPAAPSPPPAARS